MTLARATGLLIGGLAAGLAGCGGATAPSPTGPSPFQQPSQQGPARAAFPPGDLRDVTLSGVVFELTAAGRTPLQGAAVYCELCGEATHTWSITDANGVYAFTGVWNAGVFATSVGVEKAGYVDPPGLPAVTPPNPAGPGWRQVVIDGDTRFDIDLVKQ